MSRDFREALLEADRQNAEAGMPSDVDRRLRARLGLVEAPQRAARWQPVLFGAAAALAVALLVVVNLARRAPASLGEFAVSHASADFRAQVDGSDVKVVSGRAALVDEREGVTLVPSTPGTLRKEGAGIRVVAGVFSASVQKRKPGSTPARVLVSGGAIEVLGTEFQVSQHEGGAGEVLLNEGSIRFVAPDGRQVLLTPGQSLSWPLPPPPPPVPVPEPPVAVDPPALDPVPAPASARPAAPALHASPAHAPEVAEPEADRIEDLLQRIDMLRSRGQYDAAAQELTSALQARYSPATRERLSFELGTILGRSGSDPERACAHWREHAKRFPNGRYDREIDQAVRRLGCPGP